MSGQAPGQADGMPRTAPQSVPDLVAHWRERAAEAQHGAAARSVDYQRGTVFRRCASDLEDALAAQEQPAPGLGDAEARHWDGAVNQATRLIDWILANGGTARYHDGPSAIAINAPDCRTLTAVPGDWIIRQPDGTFLVLSEDTQPGPALAAASAPETAEALRRLLETP